MLNKFLVLKNNLNTIDMDLVEYQYLCLNSVIQTPRIINKTLNEVENEKYLEIRMNINQWVKICIFM